MVKPVTNISQYFQIDLKLIALLTSPSMYVFDSSIMFYQVLRSSRFDWHKTIKPMKIIIDKYLQVNLVIDHYAAKFLKI